VVLELSRGHRTLLVSAYMPSGLDHLASSSPLHSDADELYSTILKWAQGMQQVIVMGDLNETRLRADRVSAATAGAPARLAPANAAAASKHLDHLAREGFIDVYRQLHPFGAAAAARAAPGFTHFVRNPPSASRIDYLWCKGIHADSLLRARVDHAPTLRSLSHHRLLWMEMQPTHAVQAGCTDEPMRLRLPNLRAANPKHTDAFGKTVERDINDQQQRMQQLLATCDDNPAASLDAVASDLTAVLHRSAFDCFPITGSAPYKSRDMLQLERQRRALTRLLRLSSAMLTSAAPLRLHRVRFVQCAEWRTLYAQCVDQLQLQ
jgi:hypothetical protein